MHPSMTQQRRLMGRSAAPNETAGLWLMLLHYQSAS